MGRPPSNKSVIAKLGEAVKPEEVVEYNPDETPSVIENLGEVISPIEQVTPVDDAFVPDEFKKDEVAPEVVIPDVFTPKVQSAEIAQSFDVSNLGTEVAPEVVPPIESVPPVPEADKPVPTAIRTDGREYVMVDLDYLAHLAVIIVTGNALQTNREAGKRYIAKLVGKTETAEIDAFWDMLKTRYYAKGA